MREYLVFTDNRGSGPELPDGNREIKTPPAHQAMTLAAGVADMTSIIGKAQRLFLFAAALLAADIVAAAITMTALLGHGRGVSMGSAALLVPVLLAWIITVLLMIQADQPVTTSLGEVRRATGAPVDLSAPWLPLAGAPGSTGTPGDDLDLGWDHLVLFIGSATRHYQRTRVALLWAIGTSVSLLLWMALVLGVATVL